MVIAYHSIFGAYGFWLPNDPRGSWSDFVRQWELFRFGKATKVMGRHSVARAEHDIAARLAAKEALQHPPVVFTGQQARAIGIGFSRAAAESRYVIRACSILPEHAHVVISRHERKVESIVGHLKARATQELRAEGLDPFADAAHGSKPIPSPWARQAWHVYLDSDEDLDRAISYVNDNPIKEGKPRQHWTFVRPA
jgi:REP element-mobilizing transposase RayT